MGYPGEKVISARQTTEFIYLPKWSMMRGNLCREAGALVLGCITKAYLSRSGPNRDDGTAARAVSLYFYFIPGE